MSYDLLRLSLCSTICLSNQQPFWYRAEHDLLARTRSGSTISPPTFMCHPHASCVSPLLGRTRAREPRRRCAPISMSTPVVEKRTLHARDDGSSLGSTPSLQRIRPHYVDSTASRPICEVKLRQAGLVVWFVRTCEVLVLNFTMHYQSVVNLGSIPIMHLLRNCASPSGGLNGFESQLATNSATLRRQHRIPSDLRS